ncbi:MAG: response regulator [Pseudomonadota bacterium]
MTSLGSARITEEPMERIGKLAIIDDAEFDQMLYARIIARTGLVDETLCFYSAEEAVEYFKSPDSEPVDVILLDINMPGMSGFEFLELVSKDEFKEYADLVVVMLTTSLDPSDVARARSFDLVKDYINKPLEEQHIEQIIEMLRKIRNGEMTFK